LEPLIAEEDFHRKISKSWHFLAHKNDVAKHHDYHTIHHNFTVIYHPKITAKCPLTPKKARFSRPDI